MVSELYDPRVYIAVFSHPPVPFVFCKNHGPQPDNIHFSSLNPKKCVCAFVAHVLSVTLSQRKSTKEVYRKLMRNMRTDAIVNGVLTDAVLGNQCPCGGTTILSQLQLHI